MNIEFLDIAVEEMEQASVYYEQQNKGLGITFLASVSDAVKRLELFPESGALASRTVRRLLVSTFPYGIYYRVAPQSNVESFHYSFFDSFFGRPRFFCF